MYVEIPTFVKDEFASGWEGETMHKVGELYRGDYCLSYAIRLMADLNRQFLKNAQRAGADVEDVKHQILVALTVTGDE